MSKEYNKHTAEVRKRCRTSMQWGSPLLWVTL